MKLEDANHFEIGGNVDEGDADISLTCLRCPDWHEWLNVGTDEDGPGVLLADLIGRADQHVESCPAADHHARLAAGTDDPYEGYGPCFCLGCIGSGPCEHAAGTED